MDVVYEREMAVVLDSRSDLAGSRWISGEKGRSERWRAEFLPGMLKGMLHHPRVGETLLEGLQNSP